MCILASLYLESTLDTTTPRDNTDIKAGLGWTAVGVSFGMEGSKIQPENQVTVLLAVLQRLLVTGRKQTATKYRDTGAAKKAVSTISYECTAQGVAKEAQPVHMHMPCKAAGSQGELGWQHLWLCTGS